jgi:hypothetical protein
MPNFTDKEKLKLIEEFEKRQEEMNKLMGIKKKDK